MAKTVKVRAYKKLGPTGKVESVGSHMREVEGKWSKKGSVELLKANRKTVGFVGSNSQGPFYAFGSPSQAGGYIAFQTKTSEAAKAAVSKFSSGAALK